MYKKEPTKSNGLSRARLPSLGTLSLSICLFQPPNPELKQTLMPVPDPNSNKPPNSTATATATNSNSILRKTETLDDESILLESHRGIRWGGRGGGSSEVGQAICLSVVDKVVVAV